MKQITLPIIPDNIVIYEYPQRVFAEKCEFFVPSGYEAVVRKEGSLSDLYREGDRITLGVKDGPFGLKIKDQAETVLYICRKNISRPVKWGVGDIPYRRTSDSDTVIYGCSGTFEISVQNAVKLVRNLACSSDRLDTHAIGQCFMTDIVTKVRSRLIQTLQRTGLVVTAAEREQLASAIKDELFGRFNNDGLWLESFTIDAIIMAG